MAEPRKYAPEQASAGLSDQAATLAEASAALNTRRTYHYALRQLDRWLKDCGRQLDDDSLADWLALIHESGKAPSSANVALAAAKHRAQELGQDSPAGKNSMRVIKGIRRAGRTRGIGRVSGVSRWDALAMCDLAAADEKCPARGLRDAAIIAVMADGLLRVSEAVALDAEDIRRARIGSAVTIRASKTDQEGAGSVVFLTPDMAAHAHAWLRHARIKKGPAFRPVSADGKTVARRLSASAIRRAIRTRAEEAGIDGRISGHSLRIGSAQTLAAEGATMVEMQLAGRWRDTKMPAVYGRGEIESQSPVNKYFRRDPD